MAKRAAAELRDLSSRPHILVPESSDAHVRGQPNTTPVSSRLQVPSAVPARGPSPGSRGRGPSPLRRPRPRVLTPLLGLARVYTNFPAPQSNDPHGCSPRPANLQTGFVPERGEVPTASWDQERSAAAGRGGAGRWPSPGKPRPRLCPAWPRPGPATRQGGGAPDPGCETPAPAGGEGPRHRQAPLQPPFRLCMWKAIRHSGCGLGRASLGTVLLTLWFCTSSCQPLEPCTQAWRGSLLPQCTGPAVTKTRSKGKDIARVLDGHCAHVGLRDRQLGTAPRTPQPGAAHWDVHLCPLASVCAAHREKRSGRGCPGLEGPSGCRCQRC